MRFPCYFRAHIEYCLPDSRVHILTPGLLYARSDEDEPPPIGATLVAHLNAFVSVVTRFHLLGLR